MNWYDITHLKSFKFKLEFDDRIFEARLRELNNIPRFRTVDLGIPLSGENHDGMFIIALVSGSISLTLGEHDVSDVSDSSELHILIDFVDDNPLDLFISQNGWWIEANNNRLMDRPMVTYKGEKTHLSTIPISTGYWSAVAEFLEPEQYLVKSTT